MTKPGNRSGKHANEMRGRFDAKEQEYSLERKKMEHAEEVHEEREDKRPDKRKSGA